MYPQTKGGDHAPTRLRFPEGCRLSGRNATRGGDPTRPLRANGRTSRRAILCALALAAIPWSSVPAYADDDAPEIVRAEQSRDKQAAAESASARGRMLEEIVVTAQKRSQNLQQVGMAIDAFSGEQLAAIGIEDSYDVATLSPGVHISGNLAGQNTQFTIRGVTQNDFNDIVEAPVAVYLDEGYLAIAQAQTFTLFDIQRVEILKGPQGTLFGRNATGGLVHFISNQPNFDHWESQATLTYGIFDSPANASGGRIEAAIGGPLSDRVALRAAFMYNKHGGYLKNLYPLDAVGGSPGPGAGANLGGDDTLAGRFILAFEPTDRLSVRLEGNAGRSHLPTGPYQSKPTIGIFGDVAGGLELVNVIDTPPGESRATIGPGGIDLGTDLDNDALFGIADTPGSEFFGRPVPGGDFFGYIDPDGKGWRFSGDFAFKNQGFTRTWGVDGRIVWELTPDVTLTSVSDFKSYDKLLFIDVDEAPVNQTANDAAGDAKRVTQEVRLNGTSGRLTWVAGLYYLNIDDDADNGLKFPQGSVVPGAPFDLGVDARLKTNSYSGFAHFQYDVTDTLDFVLGARVIQEKKNYFFQQAIYFTQSSFQIHQGTPILIGPVFDIDGPKPFTAKTSDTLWAGVARIEYKPTADLMWWASVKRGVKAGSFNAQLAGGIPVPASAIPYKAEVLYSYETGVKTDVLNGLGRFSANVFYYDYNDYQSFLFTGVSGVVINADAKYKGAEAEFVVSPIEGLDIRLAGSWIDATVKDVPLRVGGPIIRDVRPNYTPKWQFQSMIGYEWPAFGGLMRVLAEGNYSSNFFYNLRNFDADRFDGYFLLNTRIGWTAEDDRWEVAFRIRNLTQEKAGIQGFDLATFCGCNEISFRPPRWFGLEVRYKR